MIFKIIFMIAIYFCEGTMVLNNLSPPTPYFLDEKSGQSVVYKSLDSSESEFQIEMADLLGLTERPRHIKKPLSLSRTAASKFLLDLYNSLKEEETPHLSDNHNRAARSTLVTNEDRTELEKCNNIITFSSKNRKSRLIPQNLGTSIAFNTKYVPKDIQLVRGELRIFQNAKIGRVKNVTASVFEKVLNQHMQKIDLKLLTSFTTTTNYNGWLKANITQTLLKWLSKEYTPNGHDLIISTKITSNSNEANSKYEEYVSPKDIGLINAGGTEEYQPFIIGYFNGPELLHKIQHLRFKRDIGKKNKRYSNEYQELNGAVSYKLPKTCERMNFSIDFMDLQMQDWVIAPKKFEAYFCGGECNFPLGSKMNATNHAIVQTLMHLKQPNLPKPCCVPTALGSISILHYLNEDSVNLSKYPNSVAKSCGCL